MIGIVILSLLLFSQAMKLPNDNFILDQNLFSYFITGLLFVCAILLIFGKVRETTGRKITKNTVLYTAIVVSIVFVFLYLTN
jgi:uncharacterized membrane protein YqhA